MARKKVEPKKLEKLKEEVESQKVLSLTKEELESLKSLGGYLEYFYRNSNNVAERTLIQSAQKVLGKLLK